jgi:uncharacterized membrane protein YfcA
MIDSLVALDLAPWQWFLAAVCGLLIGASKSGLTGVAFLAFPLLADIFGARASTGVALPMLLAADIFAVTYYHRHSSWENLMKLAHWVVAGLMVALVIGKHAPNKSFGMLFAVTVLLGIAIMFWRERKTSALNVSMHPWYPRFMGLSAGFATMIGNAAGPLMSLYLLSKRLPKDVFIGTAAWFYLAVNAVKVPLHIFVWQTITYKTIAFNLATAPFICIGVLGGIFTVKHISEKVYRVLVLASATLAAVILVIKFLL